MEPKTNIEAGRRPGEQNLVRYDTVALEQHKLLLPAEMQEPFVWLGSYIRDECGRDLDVFVERIAELGFDHDKTTFSKILRGRWNRDAEGNVGPACLAQAKFLKVVEAVQADARRRELAGKVPFIMTPVAQSIFDYIDTKRAPDRVNKFGVIVGETGSQKTATLKEYRRLNNHGACVWLESPENASLSEFITRLAGCYGVGWNVSLERKRNKIFDSVNAQRCLLVDNVQDLYKPARGHDQPAFAFLRRLQDERGCTVILSITPTFERTLVEGSMKGYFEQFVGRSGGVAEWLRLPAHPPEEDVVAIARGFKLRDAERHTDYLVKIAKEPGRVRRLFEALQKAKVTAEARGTALTINHVRAARGED
jgi:DNA transposition AAA+ family ATPase